jgi:hypothetical protein
VSGDLTLPSKWGCDIPNLFVTITYVFKYPNESCELILDICLSKKFQWYKKVFNPMNFGPCNHPLKVQKFIELQILKWELAWECVFIPSHFPTLSKT